MRRYGKVLQTGMAGGSSVVSIINAEVLIPKVRSQNLYKTIVKNNESYLYLTIK